MWNSPKPKKSSLKNKNPQKTDQDKESISEDSEPEFSGSETPSNELPLCEEDDDSYKPVAKPESIVVPTWQSSRNV